jgi:hypothetical protein
MTVQAELVNTTAGRTTEIVLEQPGGRTVTLKLTTDLVTQLEGAIRAWRHTTNGQRDLITEIAAAVGARPGLTTPEISKAIRARESDVRDVLRRNPSRFQQVHTVPRRSPRAICWILAGATSTTQPEAPAELCRRNLPEPGASQTGAAAVGHIGDDQ